MPDELKNGPVSDAITKASGDLKDIGLGVNTVANRLVSVGIVGVFVIIFVGGCYVVYNMLMSEISINRESSKLFLNDLKTERDRQDSKWDRAIEKSEIKHKEVVDAVKATQSLIQDNQRAIVDSQKDLKEVIGVMKEAVRIMGKKMDQ